MSEPICLKFCRMHPDAKAPAYAHPGDAGLDLYACEACSIQPGEAVSVGTGIALELPEGT